MDTGKFLRLQGMVQSVVDATESDHAVMAGKALASSWGRIGGEVRDAIPEDRREEFERLFPESLGGFAGGPRGEADRFHAAKTRLTELAGWLGGFVAEARMKMEAQAYAQARVKEERGVGFKRSGSD